MGARYLSLLFGLIPVFWCHIAHSQVVTSYGLLVGVTSSGISGFPLAEPHLKGLTILAVFVAGCGSLYYPPDSYDAGPLPTVWMVTWIAGGRQCNPHIALKPPDVANELRATGVRVYDHVERGRPECRACSCSSYSAHHYVQIEAEDEERAKRFGFELASPPHDKR